MIQYFVSFTFVDNGKLRVGNTVLNMNKRIGEVEDIERVWTQLEGKGFVSPIILFYAEMKQSYVEKPEIELRMLGEKEARRIMVEDK